MTGRPMKFAGPDLARSLVAKSAAVQRGEQPTVSKAAARAARIHEGAIARVAGADMSLSGVGKKVGPLKRKGGKVGVKVEKWRGSSGSGEVLLATGPLQLVERNTAGHVIRPQGARGTGASGRGRVRRKGFIGPVLAGQFAAKRGEVLFIPDAPGNFRQSARHPGTRGQAPWAKGRKAARPVIRKAIQDQTLTYVKGA